MSKPARFSTTLKAERADTALAACSVPARYLWFGLRLIMADAAETGFLLVDGERPKPSLIATLTGSDPAQVKELLAELESHKVFVRDARGVAYCPTMVRAAKLRANGCHGGNPNLLSRKANPALDNQEDNQHRNQGPNQAPRHATPIPLKANGNAGLDNQVPNQAPRSLTKDSESGKLISNSESLPKTPPKPPRKRRGGDCFDPAFDREFDESFWPAYPRKEAKKAARVAFAAARAKGVGLEVIVGGLERSAAAWAARRTDPTLIPHAASWLNDDRWTDEPALPSATARCGTAAGRPAPSTVLAYITDPVTGSIPG